MRVLNQGALAIAAAAGVVCPALAQDSVSQSGGLPGDALGAYDTDQQVKPYRVGVTPFTSSAGHNFAIAPIVKSSKVASAFFGSLISAQSMSNVLVTGVPFASEEYATWSGAGFGVNTDGASPPNMTPNTIMPSGESNQFGVGFTEFATPDGGDNYGGVIGAIVNYDPADPSDLFVTRVNAATNGISGAENSAQFGFGSVDAAGNINFRSDGFGATGPNSIMGNNYFRIRMADRDPGVVNAISNSGGADAAATDWVIQSNPVAHPTPSCIPQALAGRPLIFGSNFDAEYVYESAPLTTTATTTHRGADADDQRGTTSFSKVIAGTNPDAVGTAAILGRENNIMDRLSLWTVDADGNVLETTTLILPLGSISDNCDGFTTNGVDWEFDHYHSQVPFRGGNGMISLGEDADGNILAGAVAYNVVLDGSFTSPCNALFVARFDPENIGAGVEWSVAGWFDCVTGDGKAILDENGVEIGRMATFLELPTPFQATSMSGGAFDAAGNVYFLALMRDYGEDGVPNTQDDFLDTTLVRGIYDSANFCWNLEKIVSTFDVFTGADSGLDYRVSFIEINDNNSVSSGTFWSSNVLQDTFNGVPLSELDGPEDPRSLGGLVLSAEIVYDRDQDGDFIDPTSAFGMMNDPNSLDEGYNTLLWIGPAVEGGAPPCPADFTGDGVVGAADLGSLLGSWGPCAGCPQDLAGNDGVVGAADLGTLLGSWGPCPQ